MTSDGAEVSLQTDPDDNRTSTTEYAGTFDHPSGLATVPYDHDEAGDLTFDGVYRYGYDAWNRLVEVDNAYRQEGGSQNVQQGCVVTAMAYDGLGRRIVKTVSNSGDLDATLHSLYDAQSEIEERNGADLVLRQQVWGLDYIDEMVVVSTNLNPQGSGSIVVVERYEYTPFGQRQVYRGSEDDRKAYTPYLASARLGSLDHSLNPFGHQGLKHDEGIGLVCNRATKLHPGLGRFVQRDPLGYVDGMSVYENRKSSPLKWRDPRGLLTEAEEEDVSKNVRNAINDGRSDIFNRIKKIFKDAGIDPAKFPDRVMDTIESGLPGRANLLEGQLDDFIAGIDEFGGDEGCRIWYLRSAKALATGEGCYEIYDSTEGGVYGTCREALIAAGDKALLAFEALAQNAEAACCREDR